MAGGQRPPLLDYDLLVLGGRPKAALADERLIVAHSFFNACSPWYTKPHQRLQHLRLNHGCPAFIRPAINMKLIFHLARLWRALISSIYIYTVGTRIKVIPTFGKGTLPTLVFKVGGPQGYPSDLSPSVS